MKNTIAFLTMLLVVFSFMSCSKKNLLTVHEMKAGLKGITSGGITLNILPQDTDIIRVTPTGRQRMVYYNLSAASNADLLGLTALISKGSFTAERKVIDPAHTDTTMMNIMWIPDNITTGIAVKLLDAVGDTVLQQTVSLVTAGVEVVIPMSAAVKKEALQPLMVRGTNYLPRYHPFVYMWTGATRAVFESEFPEMDSLNINAIRTFYNITLGASNFPGLTIKPSCIALVNDMYDVADAHHIKTVMCLGKPLETEDINDSKRFMQSGIEPFLYDGRVLMWDLVNEPGGASGPQATPALASWMQTMYAYVTALDTNHIHTIGLTWQFDQEHNLGIYPAVEQYHQYSGTVGLPTYPGERNVRDDLLYFNTVNAGHPMMIGEFGISSNPSTEYPAGSLANQLQIYTWVFDGVNAAVPLGANVVGAFNWCAFTYPTLSWTPFEQGFGVINDDGSLKPAGTLMRNTYATWKASAPAPWE